MNLKKSTFFQFSLLLALFAAIGGTLLYVNVREVHHVEQAESIPHEGIVPFNYPRDHQFIHDIFEDDDNWYWLVEGSKADFSADEMMKTMSSSRGPGSEKNLIIKTLFVDGKHAGFLAYYMKNFYTGKIRFVYVDKELRGSGLGLKLVNYAVEDLASKGATKIALVTRSTNVPAQRIYTKAGFTLDPSPEGFAYFTKRLAV